MTEISATEIFDALEATWPPARRFERNGWVFRDGGGGGQRVSAATAVDAETAPSLAAMEREQVEMGQAWLAMIRPDDATLDASMAKAGYAIGDPTLALAAKLEDIDLNDRKFAAYPAWPPLALQEELWKTDNVGPTRLAVMARVTGPKTALLGRVGDKPVATAFIAVSGRVAMLHALVVAADERRKGIGRAMMLAAADWARGAEASWIAVLVVEANAPALALYHSLGLKTVTEYHYRRMAE